MGFLQQHLQLSKPTRPSQKPGTFTPRISLKIRGSEVFQGFVKVSWFHEPRLIISRSEDGQELCGLSFLPTAGPLFLILQLERLGFSKVITCASETQTQVSGAPHIPCHLLKCLTVTVTFRRLSESQSKPLLGQDKLSRGDERRLDS